MIHPERADRMARCMRLDCPHCGQPFSMDDNGRKFAVEGAPCPACGVLPCGVNREDCPYCRHVAAAR